MRTLKFKVEAQRIVEDPKCDFSGLIRGTEGYLKAEFEFSAEWTGCKKAASFWIFDKEYAAPIVNGVCEIPKEALVWKWFQVSVTGMKEKYCIKTNKLTVNQGE